MCASHKLGPKSRQISLLSSLSSSIFHLFFHDILYAYPLLITLDNPPFTPFPPGLGPILEFLDEWGTENLDMVDIREIANPKTTKVFVNGNWVGVHRDPEDLISKYKRVSVRAFLFIFDFIFCHFYSYRLYRISISRCFLFCTVLSCSAVCSSVPITFTVPNIIIIISLHAPQFSSPHHANINTHISQAV